MLPVLWEVMVILNWDLSVVSKAICASEAEISETCRLLKLCSLACDALELNEPFTE